MRVTWVMPEEWDVTAFEIILDACTEREGVEELMLIPECVLADLGDDEEDDDDRGESEDDDDEPSGCGREVEVPAVIRERMEAYGWVRRNEQD